MRLERNERFDILDAFKFLGIFFVVLIHSDSLFSDSHIIFYDTLNLAARVVVPVYFMISGYFIEKNHSSGTSIFPHWLAIIKRLAIPYIVWTLVYLIIPADWPSLFVSQNPGEIYHSWMNEVHTLYFQKRIPVSLLLSGGKWHLWFLFALMFSVTASLLLRRFLRPSLVLVFAFILYFIGLAIVPYRESLVGIKINWGTQSGELSLGYIGSFIGFLYFEIGRAVYARRDDIPGTNKALLLTVVGLGLTIFEGFWIHTELGLSIRAKSYLIGTIPYGVGLFLLLLSMRNFRVHPWLSYCGRYSLGLYGLHLLILDAVLRSVKPTDSLVLSLLIVLTVYLVTTILVVTLGKVRLLHSILR